MSPRLNLDDSIWSDSRFLRLVVLLQDEARAIGMLVLAWKLAQKRWCPDRRPIPESEWSTARLSEALVEAGLAERRTDGIYMKGSEGHFAWWFQRQEAGRRGGLAKASNAKQPVAGAKRNVASSSFSLSNTNTNTSAPADPYDFEAVYAEYPKRKGDQGKKKALEYCRKHFLTREQYDHLLVAAKNYRRACDAEDKTGSAFVKQFLTFVRSGVWEEWVDSASAPQESKYRTGTIADLQQEQENCA